MTYEMMAACVLDRQTRKSPKLAESQSSLQASSRSSGSGCLRYQPASLVPDLLKQSRNTRNRRQPVHTVEKSFANKTLNPIVQPSPFHGTA